MRNSTGRGKQDEREGPQGSLKYAIQKPPLTAYMRMYGNDLDRLRLGVRQYQESEKRQLINNRQ